jgi:subtilisin family serine protease
VYHPKKIVVKFDPAVMNRMDKSGFAKGKTGVPTLDLLGERYKARVIQKQFKKAKIKKSRGQAVNLSGWHRIKFDKEIDVLSVVEEYKGIPGVIWAEPVSIHKIYAEPKPLVPVEEFFSDKYSWHLNKIEVPIAWNYETGNDNIIVAILDTGVRYFHGDLGGSGTSYYNPTNISGNMWVNSAEKNGTSGVDEDGNGYFDDWIGYDFVEDVSALPAPCAQQEDCSVSDNDPGILTVTAHIARDS